MRLDKLLSNMGQGSRRDVHRLIASGQVTVNGAVEFDRSAAIDEDSDVVRVGGSIVEYKPFVYIIMNKPAGYISSTEESDGASVLELLDGAYANYSPGIAGRLDKDTEGLLLLTNDGDYIHKVISPGKDVYKYYYAELRLPCADETAELFRRGVVLKDGTVFKSAYLFDLGDARALVAVSEGKFHQVKKMFLAAGNEVLYLKRVRIGGLTLPGSLKSGEYIEISREEAVKALKSTAGTGTTVNIDAPDGALLKLCRRNAHGE